MTETRPRSRTLETPEGAKVRTSRSTRYGWRTLVPGERGGAGYEGSISEGGARADAEDYVESSRR